MKNFNYYVGIDVSKLTLDVTILYECNGTERTEYYKIENNEKSIAQFVKKKLGNYVPEQILFCFEDTGIYSLPFPYESGTSIKKRNKVHHLADKKLKCLLNMCAVSAIG